MEIDVNPLLVHEEGKGAGKGPFSMTPSGKVEIYSEKLEHLGYELLPGISDR